jgi:hypothetical protein
MTGIGGYQDMSYPYPVKYDKCRRCGGELKGEWLSLCDDCTQDLREYWKGKMVFGISQSTEHTIRFRNDNENHN